MNEEIAGTLAVANGDPILASTHFSRDEDARWHRAWTTALLRSVIEDTPGSVGVVAGWIEKWSRLASRALMDLTGVVAEAPVPLDGGAVAARIATDASRKTGAALSV